jgi:hypothetical protein
VKDEVDVEQKTGETFLAEAWAERFAMGLLEMRSRVEYSEVRIHSFYSALLVP